MTDNRREKEVRVNETDLNALKAAQSELNIDVPLGRVAREGAKRILSEDDDDGGITIA